MNNKWAWLDYVSIISLIDLLIFINGILLVLFGFSKWFVLLIPLSIIIQIVVSSTRSTGDPF